MYEEVSDLGTSDLSFASQDFLMWTSTAKPTMKSWPLDMAGIKRKEYLF